MSADPRDTEALGIRTMQRTIIEQEKEIERLRDEKAQERLRVLAHIDRFHDHGALSEKVWKVLRRRIDEGSAP